MIEGYVARLGQGRVEASRTETTEGRASGQPGRTKSAVTSVGSAIEGFLIAAPVSTVLADAVGILALHLQAAQVDWQIQGEISAGLSDVSGGALLFVADLRKQMTLEVLSRFESAVQDFADSNGGLKVCKLLLVDPIAYRRLSLAAQSLGYPQRNQFCVLDNMQRFRLDPDGEYHRVISQVARWEGRSVSLVAEDMTDLLEDTDWRFGGLELDLFLRECIRAMGKTPILTADYLPVWFKRPPERFSGVFDPRVAECLMALGIPVRKKNQIS